MRRRSVEIEAVNGDCEVGAEEVGLVERSEGAGAVVVVRDAHKAYQTGIPVLNDFNMTVEMGTIYGLLGSSGCGKTTILSCIIGMRKLDSGTIHVFGQAPGGKGSAVPGKHVGYMPQDISLYGDFTISETLTYFGSLYCLPMSIIEKNLKWLVEFLDLPDPKRKVHILSGGQKRRVSIAVAMIHDPPLLILDEPTVGVDPLLRESIWDHLVERVKKHKTAVIITTHYIEEARQSDKVGLMRAGRLLSEKSPTDLMVQFNADLLEDVVLQLCQMDKTNPESQTVILSPVRRRTVRHSSLPQATPSKIASGENKVINSSSCLDSLTRVWSLTRKNAMVLMRNYVLLIFILLVPATQVLLMCLAIGNDPKPMKFGIINHEFESFMVKNCSQMLDLRKSDFLGLSGIGSCSLVGFSCMFLERLPRDVIHPVFFKTEGEAREAVREGRAWGFMSIPDDFSSNFFTRLTTFLTDEDTISGSIIHLEMDETNKQITGTVKLKLGEAFQDFTKGLLKECGENENLARLPIQITDPIYGTDDTDMREFMAAGMLISILFFFPLISTGIQYIYEKKLGTLERALVAGVKTWEIMASFSASTSVILMVQTGLALGIVTGLFGIEVQGSLFLCLLLGILVGLTGVSLGFLIGSLCNEEVEATLLSIAMFFPVAMLSGVLWPVEGLPQSIQYFSYLLPVMLPSVSLRSIISRGWTFSHPQVWPGFGSLLGWIVIYWIITLLLHKTRFH